MTRKTYITNKELCKLGGKTHAAVIKQMRAHGVPRNRNGDYDKVAALEAMRLGADLDKRNAEKEVAAMESRGVNDGNVVLQHKRATLRRIILQGDLLQIERDKALGDLIPLEEYKARLLEMQNVCLRVVDVWIETIAAKRADGKLHQELRAAREQVLSEVTAILEEA